MEQETLAARLRRLRRDRGLSQSEVARAVGRDRSWVAHVERGALAPSREQVRLLARRLGISAAALRRGTEWTPPVPLRTPADRALARFREALPRAPHTTASSSPHCRDLLARLAAQNRDPRFWSLLERLGCREEEGWVVALRLALRGGVAERIAPARLGLPILVLDRAGNPAAHRPRPALVWNGPAASLVLLAGVHSRFHNRRVVLPLVAAAAGRKAVHAALRLGKRLPSAPLPTLDIRGITPEGADRLLDHLLGEAG